MGGSIRAFASQLNANSLLKTQSVQNSEKIVLADTIAPATRKLSRASVSNYGDFLCLYITGTFTTLFTDNSAPASPVIVDNGVDFLRGQLSDSIGQRKLFSDFIPFSLWLSPGRRRDLNAVNNLSATTYGYSGFSNTLFYPQEFEYIFAANSEILLDVYNDSSAMTQVNANYAGATLSYEITFHGIRILSDTAVQGVREMRR